MTPSNCIASLRSPEYGPLPMAKSPTYIGVLPGSSIARIALPSVTSTVSLVGLLEPEDGQ